MSVWSAVALMVFSAAVSGFLGNFAYTMLWHYLGRLGWKEASLVNWAASIIRYSIRAVPGVIVLLLGITIFGWWGAIGSRTKDLFGDAPQVPAPAPPRPQAPATTSICANAKDSNCIGSVTGPVTIYPKQQPPNYAGTLEAHDKIWLSPNGVLPPEIAIGEFNTPFVMIGGDKANFLSLFGRYQLLVESIHGKLMVSTKVADQNGALVAEIIRNEWQAAQPPRTWDMNYNDNAVEVKNDRGDIVLQVVVFSALIRLQGEWWDDQGNGRRLASLGPNHAAIAILAPGRLVPDVQIQPAFVYPSRTHLGELTPFGKSLEH